MFAYGGYGYGPHMGYGYGHPGGAPVSGPGLIKKGDEAWLDDMEEISIHKGFCSSTVIAKANGFEVRFLKKSGSCYKAYEAEYEGKVVAFFGNMGGCLGGARFVQCPPGREVLTAVVRKEGHGKHAPTFYTSFARSGHGAGAMLVRRSMNQMPCGNSEALCDGMGRIIGNVSGESCCSCCGEMVRVVFDRDATATDKLAVLDWALVTVDRGLSNPCRWSCCWIVVIVLVVYLALFAGGILTSRAGRGSGKSDSGSDGVTDGPTMTPFMTTT